MPFSAIFLLLLAIVSVQSGAAIAKQLFPLVGAMGVTVLRTSLGAIFLFGIWRPWQQTWNRQQLKRVALYGFSLGLMNLFFYLALNRIPLGIAVAFEFIGPLLLAILTSRKLLDFVWAALAAIGIVLLLPLTEASKGLDLYGALLAMTAGGFWALYIIFGKKAGEGSHGGKSAAMGMFFAAIITMPFGVADIGPVLFDWKLLPLGLGVAIFSSALPFSLEMYALKRIPIKTFGILMSLEPVVAALAGALLLNEHLTPMQNIAIASIVGASLGTTLTNKNDSPPIPTAES